MFGPAEYSSLVLLGFFCVSFVTTGNLLNGLAMCLIGVLLGQVGTDVNSGLARFTYGLHSLDDGVGLVSIALGCFGIDRDHQEPRQPRAAFAVRRRDQAHADLG